MPKHFNRFTASGGGSVLIGAGIWIMQGGLWMPDPIPPLYWVGVALMVIGAGVCLYGWFYGARVTSEQHPIDIKDIVPILQQMDARVIKLAKKEALKWFNPLKYLLFNFQANKVFFDMAKCEPAKTFEQAQMEVGKIEDTVKPITKEVLCDFERLISHMKEMKSYFENHGYGLNHRLTKDRVYLRLNDLLFVNRNTISDDFLNELIRDHIEFSECLSTFLLITERGKKFIRWVSFIYRKNAIDLMSLESQTNLAQFEHNIKEWMVNIRVAINERISELEVKL